MISRNRECFILKSNFLKQRATNKIKHHVISSFRNFIVVLEYIKSSGQSITYKRTIDPAVITAKQTPKVVYCIRLENQAGKSLYLLLEMNATLIRAVVVVTFALISYSIAVLTEQKRQLISIKVLAFLSAGVFLDISSTVLMIIGSGGIPITVHGFIGYSALIVMLIDAVLIWRFWRKNGKAHVPRNLNLYTRFATGWWVIAYIAGATISMTLQN